MTPQELLAAAQQARREGKPAEALEHLRAAVAAAPDDLLLKLELAQELRRANQPAEALAVLPEDAPSAPQRAQLLTMRGLLTRMAGDRPAALVLFQAALAANANDLGARLETAQELRTAKQFEAALAVLPETLAGKPLPPGALQLRAHILRQNGQATEAVALLRAVMLAQPGKLPPCLDLAQTLRAMGEFAEALAVLPEDAPEAKERAELLALRGHLLRRLGDRPAALQLYTKAAELAPGDVMVRLELAQELRRANQPAAALAALPEDAPGSAQRAQLLSLRAYLLRQLGRAEAALEAFKAAARAAPADPAYQVGLLTEFRQLGELQQALAWLNQMPPALRATPEMLAERGLVALAMGDQDAALRAFKAATEAPGAPADAWVQLAQCHQRSGAPEAAIAACEEALRREPTNVGGLLRLAELRMLADQHDECRALCRQARAQAPLNAWSWVLECKAAAMAEGHGVALALAEEAAATLGDDAMLLAHRLELLQQSGRLPEAQALAESCTGRLLEEPTLLMMAVRLHLQQHRLDAAEALLARWQPASISHRMNAALLWGSLAELHWRLDEAAEHYRAAQQWQPDATAPSGNLARVSILRLDLEVANAALRRMSRAEVSSRRLQGHANNPSQSLLGQVLDEYRMDGALIQQLRDIQAQPLAGRVAPLLAVVREQPEATAPAIALLLALRQSGALDLPARAGRGAVAIPPRILQFWAQGEPPEDIAALMQGWRREHPGHQWQMFNDATAAAWLERRGMHDELRAFRRASDAAQRSDLFRLAWLLREGGIYADADDGCLAPPQALVPPGTKLFCHQEDYASLGNNLLAAAPGHPVIRRALTQATEAMLRGDNDVVWLSTGPGLLTRAFAQEMADSALTTGRFLAHYAILERGVAMRATAMHLRVRYKGTRAHWSRGAFAARAAARATPTQPG